VNKIAAGEIIVAPFNALKELLENSVDAGSTSIEILVKDGGLKLLQITDNGHGIDKGDLSILCERFTTSKLKAFEDLTSIATYGFRGEALASISHIAHLRVTTKTAGSSCAWQAHYADGKLTPAKPGQSADPKPCAGRGGTQITVEDLFYNIPNRRRAFRSASEEYAKILELVSKYSVHCSHVAFSIKKQGDSGAGFSISASASKLDRIKQTNGTAAGKESFAFDCEDRRWGVRATGYASNANYNGKRTMLLLFINHRSVESSAIKKAIEQTYSLFLPKGGKPFVYLSLEIDPARVDVNVHPTKREVHFLNEDEIIEVVCNEIREKLAQVDTSRTFKTQTLLPGLAPITIADVSKESSGSPAQGEGTLPPKTPATKKPYENNLVRTDSSMRKITSMLPPALTPHQSLSTSPPQPTDDGLHYTTVPREQTTIRLSSIKTLRATVRDSMHNSLTEIFAALTYIGLVDPHRRLIAMQSGVKLFLVDYGMISSEFFYQVGLTDFGNFGRIQFTPPPLLIDLLTIAAKHQLPAADSADLDPETIVASVHAQLLSRKAMLNEYFGLEIDNAGHLLSIPLLLKGYKPSMAKLPMFLLRLGPFVDWTDEQACFHTFLVELASFYVPEQLPVVRKGEEENEAGLKRRKELEYALEHVIFPSVRGRIVATGGMLQGVVEVANLKGLYRVFERC
jgi:DNA mismatch repair protein MLH1